MSQTIKMETLLHHPTSRHLRKFRKTVVDIHCKTSTLSIMFNQDVNELVLLAIQSP